ncbi:unnamed protein product [Fraxinus pennsylvanica]|uniref:RING-type domain-containing protein n=1 Tax=Fraxinus pennsylvanica TaxID=56036 RepID=A0AAD2AEW9_9LAMI|nr:unnamed protein product [Fraxinus pennsylvanica]
MAKESKEPLSDYINESFDLSCDDFYFSLLFNIEGEDEEMILPVSDSLYAEELQLQESIMASLISSQNPKNDPISETVVGESSRRFCKICIGSKETDEMFTIPSCNHQFCADCICEHVAITIQETAVVTCPELDCRASLDIDAGREILSKDVITTWEDVLWSQSVLFAGDCSVHSAMCRGIQELNVKSTRG